jgi:hypothetical protein
VMWISHVFHKPQFSLKLLLPANKKGLKSLLITKTHLSWGIESNDQATIDGNNLFFCGEGAITQPQRCQELVGKYFFNENANNLSPFCFIEIFINVLADQLVSIFI